MCGYAAARRDIIEQKDGISRATCFERADLLKIFALKKQVRPAHLIQPRTRQNRRPLHVRTNPLMRRSNGCKVKWHSFYVRDSKYESTTDAITSLGRRTRGNRMTSHKGHNG